VENLIMARSKTYPREVRERAVALVFEQVKTGQYGSQWEAIGSVAAKVGASSETLRKWVRQAEVDAGARPGSTSEESAELKRLRRENSELRRANEILKAASAFFARELDPRLPHS
jgi:transposase